MYQFISGYTAKVAGTERGVTEPSPTFSACFGAAFLPLHPTVYADLLAEKLETHGTQVYMINTGWTGGAYGVGERISLTHTRACVRAALNGEFDDNEASFTKEPVFGFQVPTSLPGVPDSLLDARGSWDDPTAYDDQARKLAALFRANYKQFRDPTKTDYEMYGPIIPTLGR
jgi:phosphoenolpyruvate carboxykinase (ATP)